MVLSPRAMRVRAADDSHFAYPRTCPCAGLTDLAATSQPSRATQYRDCFRLSPATGSLAFDIDVHDARGPIATAERRFRASVAIGIQDRAPSHLPQSKYAQLLGLWALLQGGGHVARHSPAATCPVHRRLGADFYLPKPWTHCAHLCEYDTCWLFGACDWNPPHIARPHLRICSTGSRCCWTARFTGVRRGVSSRNYKDGTTAASKTPG